MTKINSTYSPLAIFPERDFTTFYKNLSANLEYSPPIKSIGLFSLAEWKEVEPLMNRREYDTLTQMADARDPNPLSTLLVLEIPEYGILWFGKILIDGEPQAIALEPIGNLANVLSPIPEDVTRGSIVKAARFEKSQWLSLEELVRKYNLGRDYNLGALGEDGYKKVDLAFLGILDCVFSQLQLRHPDEYAKLFRKERLVIGDIGCGSMPYGVMLAHYFLDSGKRVKILGIDPEVINLLKYRKNQAAELNPGAKVDFIPIPFRLEKSATYLKNIGIKSFDLLTMFNPSDVIDIGGLPENFRESALLLSALDDSFGYNPDFVSVGRGAERDEIVRNLGDNGYMVISENRNPYIEVSNRVLAFKYNPIMIAQRIPELLNHKKANPQLEN